MVKPSMHDDTRPTDPTSLKPADSDGDETSVVIPKASALPATLPPPPPPDPNAEAPSSRPSAYLRSLPGYDSSAFLHEALLAAADGAHEMREGRKADATSLAGLFDAQAERIGKEAAERETARAKVVDGNLSTISNEVRSLRTSLEQLSPRVTGAETSIETLRGEMRQMRVDFEARCTLMDQAIKDAQDAAFKNLAP